MGLNTIMFNILEQKRIFLTLSTMRGVSLYYNMQSLSLHSNISLFNRNRKKKKEMETVADAFKGLAATVNSRNPQVAVSQFSDACSLFSGLFGILDTSFKFAKMDYVGKVFLLFCGFFF